jgi:mannose-6-phosphate isomerase-like protein (cupin superfamily)
MPDMVELWCLFDAVERSEPVPISAEQICDNPKLITACYDSAAREMPDQALGYESRPDSALAAMQVTSRTTVEPIIVHQTVRVYPPPRRWSLAEETKGIYLEFIDDFEIDSGSKAEPHFHDTHEWYFILEGKGVVQIESEARTVKAGDLVYIPRNQRHTIYPTGKSKIRALCFAVSYQPVDGPAYIPVQLDEIAPS